MERLYISPRNAGGCINVVSSTNFEAGYTVPCGEIRLTFVFRKISLKACKPACMGIQNMITMTQFLNMKASQVAIYLLKYMGMQWVSQLCCGSESGSESRADRSRLTFDKLSIIKVFNQASKILKSTCCIPYKHAYCRITGIYYFIKDLTSY
jgi:hypothetical protein